MMLRFMLIRLKIFVCNEGLIRGIELFVRGIELFVFY